MTTKMAQEISLNIFYGMETAYHKVHKCYEMFKFLAEKSSYGPESKDFNIPIIANTKGLTPLHLSTDQ